MSLIFFHRVLISTAILFCAGFGVWALVSYLGDGDLLAVPLALAAGLAAGLLGYYLWHLPRFLRIQDERTGTAPPGER